MALDPNISLGVRSLQVPDPLAQMAQVSQIQSAQRQGEISRMQLEELKNDRIEMQQFQSQLVANGGSANLDELAKTMLKTPKLFAQGVELTKKLKEQADFERYGRDLYPELFGATAPAKTPAGMPAAPVNALAPNAAPTAAPVNALAAPASEPYPGYNESIGMTPSAAPARTQQLSPTGKTRQQLEGMIFMAQKNPLFKGMAETAKLELAEMMKAPVYHNVPGVGLVNPITKEVVMPAKAAPPTPPVSIAEFERAKTDPAFMEFLRERAAALRPPAQPRPEPTPTITSIVNPVNPNEMITIDARRYQGGGVGSPGVIGVAGKEPSAALRTNKVEEGKTQLQNDLDNLRSSFTELNRLRAIPSTERGVVSNLMSAAQSSGVGQVLGRAGGTKEQVERDVINSARLRLVSSIKNATGMSSKSLDSNVELQTMLRSLSDPGQSVDAALRIIEDLEAAYVKGSGKLPKRAVPAATGVDTSNPLLQVSP